MGGDSHVARAGMTVDGRRPVAPSFLVAGGVIVVVALSLAAVRGQSSIGASPSGTPSPSSAASPSAVPSPTSGAPDCTTIPHARLVEVDGADELVEALDEAEAGDLIVTAAGTYRGEFVLEADGIAGHRIILCARGDVTIDGGGLDGGYGLHVTGEYWSVIGFRIHNVNKGVVLDGARYAELSHLEVFDLGQEGVHFRTHSSDNVLRDSWIHDTGKLVPEFGEGVYVGSAESNWCEYTDCDPDLSHRNEIVRNRIGPNVTAEAIDVKEGTEDGIIRGNAFDGTGMTAGESWVDIKGNGWLIAGNTGRNSALHGFRVNVKVGYGHRALFSANVAEVRADGYGFLVNEESDGTLVLCDNEVHDAGAGWSNIRCARDPSGAERSGPM